MERALRRQAGPTVQVCGRVSDAELASYYQRCRALILPGVEDFGMMPVECMAAGRPVIGRRFGGTADTIIPDGPDATGVFIRGNRHHIEVEDLLEAFHRFLMREERFRVAAAIRHAQHFSPAVFRESWRALASEQGLLFR